MRLHVCCACVYAFTFVCVSVYLCLCICAMHVCEYMCILCTKRCLHLLHVHVPKHVSYTSRFTLAGTIHVIA